MFSTHIILTFEGYVFTYVPRQHTNSYKPTHVHIHKTYTFMCTYIPSAQTAHCRKSRHFSPPLGAQSQATLSIDPSLRSSPPPCSSDPPPPAILVVVETSRDTTWRRWASSRARHSSVLSRMVAVATSRGVHPRHVMHPARIQWAEHLQSINIIYTRVLLRVLEEVADVTEESLLVV